jgi:biopolymer transport protein ExbD
MSKWFVRHEGSPRAVEVPSAARVLEGLRDGDWTAEDEVRGPGDHAWRAIHDHPVFEEVVSELEDEQPMVPDETHLDMNPLIDVALVLLIFFILTATVSSLQRSIELPPEPPEGEAKAAVKKEDLKDRAFKVKMRMEEGQVVVKIEDTPVPVQDLEKAILDIVRTTGKKEMYADVAADVPWGLEAKLYDYAKAAEVHQIWWPKGK